MRRGTFTVWIHCFPASRLSTQTCSIFLLDKSAWWNLPKEMQMSNEREKRESTAGCLSVFWPDYWCWKIAALLYRTLWFEEMFSVQTITLITNSWKSSRCYFLVTGWLKNKYRQTIKSWILDSGIWGFSSFSTPVEQLQINSYSKSLLQKCSILAD